MKKKIIIISNYGKTIGLGHFYRGEKIKKILGKKYDVKHLTFENENLDINKFNFLTNEKNKKKFLIIIDIKNFNKKNFFAFLSQLKNKIIGIDPPSKVLKYFDMAWYPGIVKKKSSKLTKIFSGKYSVIPNGRLEEQTLGEKNSILFFTGGSDLKKIGDYLPEKLNELNDKYKKIWIKSKYSKKPKLKGNKKNNWIIIYNKKNLYSKKIKAKIAFCIFGTTFFELAFKGIPVIVHDPYKSSKHIKDLKTLETLNLTIWAKKKSEILKKMILLLNDKKKYRMISENLKKYFNEKKNRTKIQKKIGTIF